MFALIASIVVTGFIQIHTINVHNHCFAFLNKIADDQKSIARDHNLTLAEIEASVDEVLTTSDYNLDGMVSWEEYMIYKTKNHPVIYRVPVGNYTGPDQTKLFKVQSEERNQL